MKLKNKKTGEIAESSILNSELVVHYDDGRVERYSLLPEHYEEPKEWWYIDIHGPHKVTNNDEYYQKVKDASKEVGNYFSSRENAEKAVEKLKAWKRLKDKGVKIIDYECYGGTNTKGEFLGEVKVTIDVPQEVDKYFFKLLFGGEE